MYDHLLDMILSIHWPFTNCIFYILPQWHLWHSIIKVLFLLSYMVVLIFQVLWRCCQFLLPFEKEAPGEIAFSSPNMLFLSKFFIILFQVLGLGSVHPPCHIPICGYSPVKSQSILCFLRLGSLTMLFLTPLVLAVTSRWTKLSSLDKISGLCVMTTPSVFFANFHFLVSACRSS